MFTLQLELGDKPAGGQPFAMFQGRFRTSLSLLGCKQLALERLFLLVKEPLDVLDESLFGSGKITLRLLQQRLIVGDQDQLGRLVVLQNRIVQLDQEITLHHLCPFGHNLNDRRTGTTLRFDLTSNLDIAAALDLPRLSDECLEVSELDLVEQHRGVSPFSPVARTQDKPVDSGGS